MSNTPVDNCFICLLPCTNRICSTCACFAHEECWNTYINNNNIVMLYKKEGIYSYEEYEEDGLCMNIILPDNMNSMEMQLYGKEYPIFTIWTFCPVCKYYILTYRQLTRQRTWVIRNKQSLLEIELLMYNLLEGDTDDIYLNTEEMSILIYKTILKYKHV
jgi:hypothetical protein